MKKTTLKLMLALTCVAALTALALAAVPATLMTAKIPFAFQVGNKTFPAGTYAVSRASSPGVVILRNQEDPNKNVAAITHAHSSRTENEKATLQFRRYGNEYFLAKVMPAGTATNLELQKSRNERETADGAKNLAGRTVQPEIISIVGQ
jgi:hypothetical protein